MPDAVRALQEAARSLEVFGLVKALDNFRMQGNMIKLKDGVKSVPRAKPYFSRKSFPELHDVIIQTEDGGEIGAHRCVLAARLEYFRSMFGLGWIETKEGQSLSLPVPTKVLHVIIEYIYRDEASTVEGSDDIELVCNVLVTADQLLMKRLIQICERQLATMITLKNVGEVLQFAFDYNAEQLQVKHSTFSLSSDELIILGFTLLFGR